jgi:hypothetical protein
MMAETWIIHWYLAKYGRLLKTERAPPQISLHTFYCPHTGETRKFNATCEGDRMVKRREIVRELIPSSE